VQTWLSSQETESFRQLTSLGPKQHKGRNRNPHSLSSN
jgi:hypothetical protein